MNLETLRALVPSWKLFDRPGSVPRLWYRADAEPWCEWRPKYRRGLPQLFINGEGNLNLQYASLLDRLLLTNSIEDSTDFKILREFVRDLARERSGADKFQFRIDVLDPRDGKTQNYLLSPEYRMDEA